MLRMVILAACCVCLARPAFAAEFGKDVERDSVSLNGAWEVLREHGDEEMWKPEVAAAAGKWEAATVPGGLVNEPDKAAREGTKFVWAKRTFTLDAAHAARNAVLRWGGIRFGAAAWLNGQKLCEHTAVGPNTVMIPAGVTKPGENVLMLKVPGWAGVAKSKSGFPLMPTGAATQTWGAKQPAVFYDIWMEFYDAVYMKRVLAMPNLKDGTVTFRVSLDGIGERPDDILVWGQVCPRNSQMMVGTGQTQPVKGQSPVDLSFPIRGFKPWTLEDRSLYVATLQVRAGGKVRDQVRLCFGMRELKVENGRYTLNGRPFRFRGSNLVNEWHWGENFNQNCKRYIVDEARAMSLNSFRTHTCPPPHSWLNVADQYGTFILAELPILYNYANFKFTPEEYEIFHANALADAEGWVTELWNHPSVAVWVLSNESPTDARWETGPLQELVNSLDPTRTTLRTGTPSGTKENVDIHTCGNVSRESEGTWMETFAREAARKDPKRALTNTEYMNTFGDSSGRWLGAPKDPRYPLTYAEFAMEHTEGMRRLGYDGVFPYMYAGWTGFRTGRQWRADYPTEMSASLHSCMAPVLASLDLYDRNFAPAQEMTTRVALINDTLADVPAKLDLYVTTKDPMLVPDEDALKTAVRQETMNVTFKAASTAETTVKWKVPEKEGCYWLALVTTREGDKPVVSQRVVRAVGPNPKEAALKGRRVLLIGGDVGTRKWLEDRGIQVWTELPEGGIAADACIIVDPEALGPGRKADPKIILDYAKAGGRVVILDPPRWTWDWLVDYRTQPGRSSRAFAYPDTKHWLLDGIEAEWLKRWNGIPNSIADRAVRSTAAGNARNILWIEDPAKPVVTSIPMDKGEILLCLLKIRPRLVKGSKDYDPVAERMMVNLVAK